MGITGRLSAYPNVGCHASVRFPIMINDRFKKIRTSLRRESKFIIDNILDNHFAPNKRAELQDVCIFCNEEGQLTKEHVLPRWLYQNDTTKFFITSENEQPQTYNKSTVPACPNCNNENLGYVEKHIKKVLSQVNPEQLEEAELTDIIRWLELMEYKFHVMDFRRKFKASKAKGYIEFLAPIPITVMRNSINYSPYKAASELRQAQKRATVKNKSKRLNSIVVFGTKNKNFHFFHSMNNYIFFELPQFGIGFFLLLQQGIQ